MRSISPGRYRYRMGGWVPDAAIEAADVVIMTDEPSKTTAIK